MMVVSVEADGQMHPGVFFCRMGSGDNHGTTVTFYFIGIVINRFTTFGCS